MWKKLSVHGNTKESESSVPKTIPKDLPLLGPRFCPPTWLHLQKRSVSPGIEPKTAYLKALTIIHPLYYPDLIKRGCPQCLSANVRWDSWNSAGHRELYGVDRNECALGYQMRCMDCKVNGAQGESYCFASTAVQFWQRWQFWDIPRTSVVQFFFARSL